MYSCTLPREEDGGYDAMMTPRELRAGSHYRQKWGIEHYVSTLMYTPSGIPSSFLFDALKYIDRTFPETDTTAGAGGSSSLQGTDVVIAKSGASSALSVV